MNNGQKSLSINETFIVEGLEGDVLSACTGFFTNALVSCSGNTQILLGTNIIQANSAFSATTFYGDGSNLTGISTQDTFVTGGTYSQNSGVATFTNNTGGTFSVTGFYTGATDVYVTAVTFTNNLLTLYRNDGATFGATIDNFASLNVNGPVSATTFYGDGSNLSGISTQDTFVTGGTYSNGTAVFTNNTGGTFNVTGFYTGATDVFVTGGTYFDGVTTFTNNTGGTFTIDGPSNYNSGVIIGGENWVDNGNGSINLPEIKVALFDNPDYIEPLKIYTIASGTTGVGGIPPLADNDTNYIIVEYNNGLPRYNVLDNDGTVDNSDIVLYMIVYRANNFVHTLEFGNMGAGLPNKLTTRLIATDRFARESGCALGLSGLTGIVTLSSGAVWNGPNRQIVSAVNSQDDVFFKSFHSGGTWVYTTTGNTINNSFYDDGTDLILATAGKYLVNWYFRGQEVNDHLYELISFGEYDTVQLAEASPEPNLPELITSHAFLVGRVIIEVSATTGITQSAFTTVFQPSGAPVLHNDLAGIQGGIAGEYYHLDSNKYNNLALTNTDNNFSVGQSFSGGLSATTISATTYLNLPPSGSILTSGSTLYSTNPSTSNFNTTNGIFLGQNAGNAATNAFSSNFLGQEAGQNATNANNSNFFGFNAGRNATNANSSNFMGGGAGSGATGASSSNFLGLAAGRGASGSLRSNFLGESAGFGATNSENSNFLGWLAGRNATSSFYSNFIGSSAGNAVTGSTYSNFIGWAAGSFSNANWSNFIGSQAGQLSINTFNSNFIGTEAGRESEGSIFSNFIGFKAGSGATGSNNIIIGTNISLPSGSTNSLNLGGVLFGTGTYAITAGTPSLSANTGGRIGIGVVNPTETLHVVGNTRIQGGLSATTISATTYQNLPPSGSILTSGSTLYSTNPSTSNFSTSNSIFFGSNAGSGATVASNSNFFGFQAGRNATAAQNSNFLGQNAGSGAASAAYSNFLGDGAGSGATIAQFSNFLGNSAGLNATNASFSNFFGSLAGNGGVGATHSNFFGSNAGNGATNASQSNFLGQNAGQGATNASGSNFFGDSAGQSATGAAQSNFIGLSAGQNATAANNSNFFNVAAGFQATNARHSNFLGQNAGRDATNARFSNFLGNAAGQNATAANNSNFMGPSAGFGATNATSSNFLGVSAGQSATGASQSNLFGWQAGFANSTSNSIGSNNIIIGTNITLSARTTNSINLGGVLFGTGTYSLTAGTPTFSANTGGRIGIGVVIPQETLHVSGNTRVDGGLSATTISATTYLNLPLDIRVTGGTYSNGTAVFTNNTGGTFNVTGLTTPFTGGTVSGVTNFTGGLGVGVAVPTTRLHISGATAGDSGLRLETLTSVTPVSLGQAIGVDGNGNIVTINNVSGSTGPRPITTVIADTTLTDLDQVVIVNSTTPITITLPQITISGRLITIKNINTGVETILPYSGQLIDGDTSVVVARKNVSLDFQSYNNNWYLI